MPNTPTTWIDILTNLSLETKGVLIAIIIAAMRVIVDNEETKPARILLEALICGALSYAISSGITAAGMDNNWAIFAGGMIGYIGSATVRGLALRVINKKIDNKK